MTTHTTAHERDTTVSTPDELHERLSALNARRLAPATPIDDWASELTTDEDARRLEAEFLDRERAAVRAQAKDAPTTPKAFLSWFEELKKTGYGQGDPLYPWLAESATADEMRWFILQELSGEAGFDDLVALTQLRMPKRVKLEMARNYWDEMGRGKEPGMHGPMLDALVDELQLSDRSGEVVWESLAVGNLLVGLAANRRYGYHSVGALGAVELTAPGRCVYVTRALDRLGITKTGLKYYRLHASVDVRHSRTWNREVIWPLIEAQPQAATWIAEGALMRLRAGARSFSRYREALSVS